MLALPPSAPWPGTLVSIGVDGAAAGTVELPRGSVRTASLPLPRAGRVVITLDSDRSFVPAESGSGSDRRELAVQLLEVRLSPAVTAAPSVELQTAVPR